MPLDLGVAARDRPYLPGPRPSPAWRYAEFGGDGERDDGVAAVDLAGKAVEPPCPAGRIEHPVAPRSLRPGGGRFGHSLQRQSSPARRRCDPHSGQHQESSCQRWPAANQVTWRAWPAA